MRPHERQLSGYLLARAALGRKIDDTPEITKLPDGRIVKSEKVLHDLRAAHDSVQETRRLLPNGRGNVKEDILATGGEASRMHLAGAVMREHYLQQKFGDSPEERFSMQTETAVSLITGQASCLGSALVAAHVHASRLGQGQAVAVVANDHVDHVWSEARRPGSDRSNDVILDRWTSGPAILKQDSRFGQDPRVEDIYSLAPEDRDHARDTVASITDEIKNDPELMEEFKANLEVLGRMDYRFAGKTWNEENVMGKRFRKHAAARLHAPRPAYGLELLAAGAARSLGEGVRSAVDKAPGIVETAKAMFPERS
jgi:hypothetical protein